MLEEVEVLWAGSGRRWFHGRWEGQSFLVEEREWPDEASALEALSQDERWKQWLSYSLVCWPVYVEQVFRDYMADEELTLELAFRLTLIWSGMLGKGLRRVALEKPRPDMIYVTGEGDVLAAPPRLVGEGEPGFARLLEGMAEIIFAALTRQEVSDGRQELARCRDQNLKLALDGGDFAGGFTHGAGNFVRLRQNPMGSADPHKKGV